MVRFVVGDGASSVIECGQHLLVFGEQIFHLVQLTLEHRDAVTQAVALFRDGGNHWYRDSHDALSLVSVKNLWTGVSDGSCKGISNVRANTLIF